MSLFTEKHIVFVTPMVGIKNKTKYPLVYDIEHDKYYLSGVTVINGKYTSRPYICHDKNNEAIVFDSSAFDEIIDVDNICFINLCARFHDGLSPEDITYFGEIS